MIRGLFRKRALRRSKLLHNDIGNARHVVDRALLRLATGHATFIVTLNPEIMEECVRDATYHDVLDRADIITCDGVGVTLAAAVQGYGLPRRVTGVEISRAFLEYSARAPEFQSWSSARRENHGQSSKDGRDRSARIFRRACHPP